MLESPFTPNKDILPAAQRQIWPELRPAADFGFALYGGTAIALRLGHRVSVDFDFFTEQPLEKEKLYEAFSFLSRSTVLQDGNNTLVVNVPVAGEKDEVVKVSFFGGIGFGRVGVPQRTRDGVLFVASLDDLMATKVKTIIQRVNSKDYMDIAAMIKAGVSLAKGLAAAAEMFKSFQPSISLKTMAYFEGEDLQSLTPEIKQILKQAVSQVTELPPIKLLARTLAPLPR